jgi:hypothetical protein
MLSQNLLNKKAEIISAETKEGQTEIKTETITENRKSSRIMTIKLLNF